MKFILFVLFILIIPKIKASNESLNFDPAKNGIQILPQRFDYTLFDENQLKIGDVMIDFRFIDFQFKNKNIIFRWPSGFLKNGTLIIKDNSGKAIFEEPISQKKVKYFSVKDNADKEIRSEVAIYTTTISKKIIEDMKYMPFMNFCVYREDQETKIYLCSKELFLTEEDKSIKIKARPPSKLNAEIMVNGLDVGRQGMIALNSNTETVDLKIKTQSSAFVEIETKTTGVDYKDVYKENEKIYLVGSGALPVDKSKYKMINNQDWKFLIDPELPYIYIRGSGDIPLRQETYIKKDVPKLEDKIKIYSTSQRTYSSRITVKGPQNNRLNLSSDNKNDLVEFQDGDFNWQITNLPFGKSRHFIKLTESGNTFFSSFDIERDYSFYTSLFFEYLTQAGSLGSHFNFDWFFNSHLSVGIKYNFLLTKLVDKASYQMTEFKMPLRFSPGFYFDNSTFGISALYDSVTLFLNGTSASTSAPGLQLFWMNPNQEIHLNYFFTTSKPEFPITQFYSFDYFYNFKLTRVVFPLGIAYYNINDVTDYSALFGIGMKF